VTGTVEGANVVLRIADTGVGIGAEALPRVFDPFFTTREVGGGRGLGLSMVLGVVRGYGGDVEITSKTGEGTAVVVRLPTVP
jgi:signal transduction histidine kinase